MKAAITNPDKRNELVVVVLDKKNIAISDFEFRRIANFKSLVANRAAEHLDGVGGAGLALYVVFNLEGHVSFDVALRALSRPNGLGICHCSLKNELCLSNELLKSWRDHGRCRRAAQRNADQGEWKEMFGFHVIEIFWL